MNMKQGYNEVKREVKEQLLEWNNLKNKKLKVLFVLLFMGVIALKIFTTVLTFDWIAGLFN